LEKVWQQWGLPNAIRTDNGAPFGIPTRDVIPPLSLWLLGHGIIPILNRPRRPQDNAKVERSQGTTARWAEIEKAQNAQQLQKVLNEVIRIQRDIYPNRKIGNAARAQVFKDLYIVKRPFDKQNFNEKLAYQKLEAMPLQRKVS
jgi:transposase InsO family protein